MKVHVKDGLFVDRDVDGTVTLENTGDVGPTKFTPEDWAKLTVAGSPVQDDVALDAALSLQQHGRVLAQSAPRRVLTFDLQFTIEAVRDEALFQSVSDALNAFAAYNLEHHGPAATLVTVAGVNFRVGLRNDYYQDGVLVDTVPRSK